MATLGAALDQQAADDLTLDGEPSQELRGLVDWCLAVDMLVRGGPGDVIEDDWFALNFGDRPVEGGDPVLPADGEVARHRAVGALGSWLGASGYRGVADMALSLDSLGTGARPAIEAPRGLDTPKRDEGAATKEAQGAADSGPTEMMRSLGLQTIDSDDEDIRGGAANMQSLGLETIGSDDED